MQVGWFPIEPDPLLQVYGATTVFDAQPVLQGESIRVRPLRPEDFTALYAVASDPLIWEQHPVQDRHRLDVFREFFGEAVGSGGALAVETIRGELIGSSRFHDFDQLAGEVEIGWTFLARSHWGGQTNRELKSLMLGHAFQYVERVFFRVGPENRRSQRSLEKLGATWIGECADGSGDPGRCRRWRPCTQRCVRSVLFVISRGDWVKQRTTRA
jgi:RimJ/RimL family protein N-acetyltransferase